MQLLESKRPDVYKPAGCISTLCKIAAHLPHQRKQNTKQKSKVVGLTRSHAR